uniref:Putative signal peptide peptidase n=1 Tax=Trypanosoma congolense (strain IL3000) TaxID=1068625 RepID=G0UKF7_TRYCI|nr:putative signal peptide peptidase [Trypanosoma congolense IL3000]
MNEVSEALQLYVALGYLMISAVVTVYLGSWKLLQETARLKKSSGNHNEVMKTGDAMMMPLMGSVVLFSVYVVLKFIPREYINAIISFYLSLFGVFSLGSLVKLYLRPNIFTGVLCCLAGGVYYVTGSWMINNLLATAIAVSAIGSLHLGSFACSFVLLLGLFFYDIFWVFGSDVMLTVASGVDGPIKLLFPRDILDGRRSMTLLGLGDIIIPGFFVGQTLLFSSSYLKKGNLYFNVALIAYTLSLVNTMAVMVIFEHGQPALLFIVPWLLITFVGTAVLKGDCKAAWEYTSDAVTEPEASPQNEENKIAVKDKHECDTSECSVTTIVIRMTKGLFGWDSEDGEHDRKTTKVD